MRVKAAAQQSRRLFVFFALLQSLICFFMQRLYKNEQNTEKQGFKHLTLKIKYGKIV